VIGWLCLWQELRRFKVLRDLIAEHSRIQRLLCKNRKPEDYLKVDTLIPYCDDTLLW
jgi:hypothetical protein